MPVLAAGGRLKKIPVSGKLLPKFLTKMPFFVFKLNIYYYEYIFNFS